MQKSVNLANLIKSFQTSIFYLFAKIGVDTAENEPVKVCQKLANRQKNKLEVRTNVAGIIGQQFGRVHPQVELPSRVGGPNRPKDRNAPKSGLASPYYYLPDLATFLKY